MMTTTATGTRALEVVGGHHKFITRPPFVTLTPRAAGFVRRNGWPGQEARLRRMGHRRQLVVDNEIVGSAEPMRSGRQLMEYDHQWWELQLHETLSRRWAPTLGGTIVSELEAVGTIEVAYMHEATDWWRHQRLHRAWLTGSIRINESVPAQILALGLSLVLPRSWFGLRTGTWTEARREWDFGGF